MKKIFIFILLLGAFSSQAQIKKVNLQASGLTCSMCSNAINKALKTLDFVLTVHPDIKTYTFEIFFKPNSNVDFDLIKNKVEGAGFFVSAFYATLNFENTRISPAEPVLYNDKTLLFVNTGNQVVAGDKQIKIIDKGYVSNEAYKKSNIPVNAKGSYHVTL